MGLKDLVVQCGLSRMNTSHPAYRKRLRHMSYSLNSIKRLCRDLYGEIL